MRPARARPGREVVVATAGLLALAAACFATVRPTNFGGSDEWLILSLLSRGILGFPWANRPLNLIWAEPAWLILPDRLTGFLVLHVLWIGLGGVLVFLVVRRLLPGAAPLPFLAGAFTIVWAPSDGTRLCAVQMILYSGSTFGVLLATWLSVEAWSRRKPWLLAGALAAATVAVLSIEASLAPLALVPLLFLVAGGSREPRRLAAWTLPVLLFLVAGGVRTLLPFWTAPESVAYQAGLAEHGLAPASLVSGSLRQLRRHLAPLIHPPTGPWAWTLVAVAVVVFVAGLGVWWSFARRPPDEGKGETGVRRRRLLVAAAGGGVWAFVSYLPFATTTRRAFRTEFFSAPGVAVLLAAGVVGAASLLPKRARLPAAGLLAAWIVALGVQWTAVFQARWDEWSPYHGQRRTLLELTALAPGLAPGTLVVLLPRDSAWPFDMTFRHAILYLYEGRAAGHVVGADPLLYETRFEATGIRSIPAPVIRGPWREPVTLYPYDSVAAFGEDAKGRLRLLETWPAQLPALPPGAVYAPRSRLVPAPPPRRLSVLGR
jgi:uncharacterized membrane protein